MITNSSVQLKALVNNLAKKKNLPPQIIMQNYLMERFLIRISLSPYKDNFIIKGGFLIASLVGVEVRSTMDLDLTAKGIVLSETSIEEIFNEICSIEVRDNISFSINKTTVIRDTFEYPGIRVGLIATYPPMRLPMYIDVTTGDKITPKEIKHSYSPIFGNKPISILAYNIETIFAEKFETILSRDITNTRLRDFYDIYILYSLRWEECNLHILKMAIHETVASRGSLSLLPQYESILTNIKNSIRMNELWGNYQANYDYARDISFKDTCNVALKIMDTVFQ